MLRACLATALLFAFAAGAGAVRFIDGGGAIMDLVVALGAGIACGLSALVVLGCSDTEEMD